MRKNASFHPASPVARPLAAVLTAIIASLSAQAQPMPPQELGQFALQSRPDALLAIDLTREAVVERIVAAWSKEIPAIQIADLKAKLGKLRADHLLAANLSGSFEGVLEVISSHGGAVHVTATQHPTALEALAQADKSKALGDSGQDLVYYPINPCLLMDTRPGVSPAPPIGGPSLLSGYAIRNIQVSGNCGIPSAAEAVSAQFTVENIPSTGGVLFAGKSGVSGGSSVVSWSSPSNYASGSAAIPISAAGQMQLQSAGSTQVVVNVNGYFARPFATSLSCEWWFQATSFAAGSGYNAVTTPSCTPGRELVATSCYTTAGGNVAGNYLQSSGPFELSPSTVAGRCEWYVGGTGFTGRGSSKCCFIPGR